MTEESGQNDLVTVAKFDSDLDASLARQCLAGAGIPAFLADHSTVAAGWHLTGTLGGVKLQVKSQDLEEAMALLAKAQAGELEVEEDWRDVGADEDEEEGDQAEDLRSHREQTVDRSLKSMAIALLFLPLAFYSGWLLLDVATSDGALGARHRRRAAVAGIVTAIQLGIFLLFMREAVRGFVFGH